MTRQSLASLLLLIGLSACYSVKTASGRPELKVRLPPPEIKARIVNNWTVQGWMVQSSDDLGVTLTQPTTSMESAWIGRGIKRIRVNLLPLGLGVTQIRASCYIETGSGATDISGARLGSEIQQSLVSLFAREATMYDSLGPTGQAREEGQLDFEVMSSSRNAPTKLALNVRLAEPISQDKLSDLADLLYQSYSGQDYLRVFITYRLPDTPDGGGAWATTHWDPDREVKILGMPAGAAEELAKAAPEGTETLGKWEQRSPLLPGVITIYREGSQWFAHTKYKDGSESTKEVERSGDRIMIPGNRHGEFYRLTSGGKLEVHDRDGLIGTARPLQ